MDNDELDINGIEADEGEEFARGGEEQLRAESIRIVRELILKGHRDLVADLVQGETLTQLMESIEPARAAYEAIAEAVRQEVRVPVAPVVPAGGVSARIDLASLNADGLIK